MKANVQSLPGAFARTPPPPARGVLVDLNSLTGVTLDCGYYGQAHFIHDFRQWSGRSPSEMSDSYNRR
ncbi:MAG: hypothetical protein IT167_06785 [Bryobacterales bacterium]|nr:hypothetical protein [Bryobacterales bacterium]